MTYPHHETPVCRPDTHHFELFPDVRSMSPIHPTSIAGARESLAVSSRRKSLRRFFIRPLLLMRAKRLTPLLQQAIGNNRSMLDLGCGDMILTEYMQHNSELKITPLDTVDSNLSHLPLTIYNGSRIPFNDKSFDVTLVSFVLHHCNDIHSVLEEIVRVTRHKVIILEEIYGGPISKTLLYLHDHGNRFLSSKMDIPLNFLSIAKWTETFSGMNLEVAQNKRIFQYPCLNLTHQVMFELNVRPVV